VNPAATLHDRTGLDLIDTGATNNLDKAALATRSSACPCHFYSPLPPLPWLCHPPGDTLLKPPHSPRGPRNLLNCSSCLSLWFIRPSPSPSPYSSLVASCTRALCFCSHSFESPLEERKRKRKEKKKKVYPRTGTREPCGILRHCAIHRHHPLC
jgi:hypothetical protein